jgi:ribosomal protein L37AE/L43A
MACPNCGSKDVWDDNACWGCNKCKWCSLAGLNKTRTPSAPYSMEPDRTEVERRAADWAEHDREQGA